MKKIDCGTIVVVGLVVLAVVIVLMSLVATIKLCEENKRLRVSPKSKILNPQSTME